jgi:hypothetical protein
MLKGANYFLLTKHRIMLNFLHHENCVISGRIVK